MELKNTRRPILSRSRNRRQTLGVILLTFLGSGLLFGLVGLYVLKKTAPHRFEDVMRSPGQWWGKSKAYVEHLPVDIPRLHIDLTHKQYELLAFSRQKSLDRFPEKHFEFVPADMHWAGQTLPVKMRLKGDRKIHFSEEKGWSFRVEVKEGKTLAGMRRFSLHRSRARNYVYEWLYHDLLRREGLVSLRYQFIEVMLNGTSWGIYALEEHFDKHLIEASRQREGPIVHFEEELSQTFLPWSHVRVFREDIWLAGDKKPVAERAIHLLESFRDGSMAVHQVFDVEKMARLFAVSDVFGSYHGAIWKSLCFYYNPITDRLEPVGYDGHFRIQTVEEPFLMMDAALKAELPYLYEYYRDWYAMWFQDSSRFDRTFFEAYVQALDRVSQPDFLDEWLTEVDSALQHQLAILSQEPLAGADHSAYYGPDLFAYSSEAFYHQAAYAQSMLHALGKRLHVYPLPPVEGQLRLEAANIFRTPVEVIGLRLDSLFIPFPQSKLILADMVENMEAHPTYHSLAVAWPQDRVWHDSLWQQLRLVWRIPGLPDTASIACFPFTRKTTHLSQRENWEEEEAWRRHDFWRIDEPNKTLSWLPGEWALTKPLYIPSGWQVQLTAGTRIELTEGAFIYSRSQMNLAGEAQRPVQIVSPDQSGGVLLLQAPACQWEHVMCEGLRGPQAGHWQLTGGITFYETAVEMRQISCRGAAGEDGLNLVRGSFYLENITFEQAEGDALDIDFGEGSIKGMRVLACGNDGLDISGSNLKLTDFEAKNVGDKGLSIGEGSSFQGTDLRLEQVQVGLGVKDQSQARVQQLRLVEAAIGLGIYQKKPEFGPAYLEVTDYESQGLSQALLLEKGSQCLINGEPQAVNAVAVAQQLESEILSER
ncbi:MAG: CotH kinase family protein [Bacteroidota bacterium]